MEEIMSAVLASPAFRTFVEGVAVKIIADIFHRRSIDPDFLTNSDAAFAALSAAQTDEDKQNALVKIQALMSSSA